MAPSQIHICPEGIQKWPTDLSMRRDLWAAKSLDPADLRSPRWSRTDSIHAPTSHRGLTVVRQDDSTLLNNVGGIARFRGAGLRRACRPRDRPAGALRWCGVTSTPPAPPSAAPDCPSRKMAYGEFPRSAH